VGAPSLSIVIPAYDEESRIGGTLSRTFAYLDAELPESEVLVVADGSTDRTEDIVRRLADDEPRLRLLVSRVNCGKGAAVRRGVLESVGRRVLFMDADLATPLSEVAHLLAALDEGYDVAIGSRAHRESEIVERQPWARERMGKTFNVFVQALVIRGYWDTQCGFKAFTREAADALFDRLTIERFAFDVERRDADARRPSSPACKADGRPARTGSRWRARPRYPKIPRLTARATARTKIPPTLTRMPMSSGNPGVLGRSGCSSRAIFGRCETVMSIRMLLVPGRRAK
jgi:dolichyl-phosphate beta-glucosyltransferase